MKPLGQMEPRRPLAGGASTVTIDTSGAYSLTGDIVVETGNGIVISADNVTLDLNGFTISSTAGTVNGSGIFLTGNRSGVHLRSGHIQGTLRACRSWRGKSARFRGRDEKIPGGVRAGAIRHQKSAASLRLGAFIGHAGFTI